MTAEVVIMNKTGIALAADSTVTVGDKTYNTTNKLFSLSKVQPVAILIWGATELTKIPLEILIKEFRESLGSKSFDRLTDYSAQFVKFLNTKAVASKKDQQDNLDGQIAFFADWVNTAFRESCRPLGINPNGNKLDKDATRHFPNFVKAFRSAIKKRDISEGLRGLSNGQLKPHLGNRAQKIIKNAWLPTELTTPQVNALRDLCLDLVRSDLMTDSHSGIAIAGYGAQEIFPSLVAYVSDGHVAGKLKIQQMEYSRITTANPSIIQPFAQHDAAHLFMEGIDQSYQEYLEEGATELFVGLAKISADYFGVTDQNKISAFKKALAEKAKNFISASKSKRRRDFVMPVLRAVVVLDKEEMATLAESIVSLTALKQKVSLELETVGGPIDVAFVSKNDGFIWIKRKHYFRAELNPFFFQRYLSGVK